MPIDPELFRTTHYKARRYIDLQPACDIADPTGAKEKLINVTTLAKAIGSQSFWGRVGNTSAPLDAVRTADYARDNWELLSDMRSDERHEMLALSAGRDLARAASRGTAVHAMIESLLGGAPPMLLEDEAAEYLKVAEDVAADFADQVTVQEFVAFNRSQSHTPYGGTGDAMGANLIIDWKTRGPRAKHGAYEKEVAQLGLLSLCGYYFAEDADGAPHRVQMPVAPELMVVSIKPDSYEVFPVDLHGARAAAEAAIETYETKRNGERVGRAAVGASTLVPVVRETVPVATIMDAKPAASAGAGAAAVSVTVDPPSADSLAWFMGRYDAALAAGATRKEMAAAWPHGVAGPKNADQWSGADYASAVRALETVEAVHQMPFETPDPATPPVEPRNPWPITPTTTPMPLHNPEDSGTITADAAEVDALRHHYNTDLNDGIRDTLTRWQTEANQAGRPWHMGKQPVGQRRFSVARAAITVASQTLDDEIARGWVALVLGEVAIDGHGVGPLLGSLTISEADRLTELAALPTYAAAIAAAAADA